MKLSYLFLCISLFLGSINFPQFLHAEEFMDEVFLLERQGELLAFTGLRNNWVAKELRTGETVVKSSYDGNVAVAYTSDRALAFSGITGRWAEESFRIRESVVSISAEGNVATVITNIRALGFSAKSGVWVESKFNIGE